MSTLKERQALIGQMAQAMGKSVYNDAEGKHKDVTPRLELRARAPSSSLWRRLSAALVCVTA